MVTATLLAGAAVGLGIWLIVLGLYPRRVPLALGLAALRPSTGGTGANRNVAPAQDLWEQLGTPLVRVLQRVVPSVGSWTLPSLACDLRVLGRSADAHLCQKVLMAVLGLALPTAVSAGLVGMGISIPWTPPLLAAFVCLAVGFMVPDDSVRTEAKKRRQLEFRPALAIFLDLVSVSLAAGAGVEEALGDAARTGRGWAFTQLSRALEGTRLTGTPWDALGQLGEALGIAELQEIAASVGLAGMEGAPVQRSLAARAEAMRAQRLIEADAQAKRATDLMTFPVVLLAMAFMVFLAFPSLSRVMGGP